MFIKLKTKQHSAVFLLSFLSFSFTSKLRADITRLKFWLHLKQQKVYGDTLWFVTYIIVEIFEAKKINEHHLNAYMKHMFQTKILFYFNDLIWCPCISVKTFYPKIIFFCIFQRFWYESHSLCTILLHSKCNNLTFSVSDFLFTLLNFQFIFIFHRIFNSKRVKFPL